MNWLAVLKTVLDPGSIVQSFIDNREHKRETKAAIQTQRLKNIQAGRVSEAQWNTKAMDKMDWKLGWFTLLLSIPLVLAFIPSAVTHINAGFAVLENMPMWYQAGIGSILAVVTANKQLQKMKFNKAYSMPGDKS